MLAATGAMRRFLSAWMHYASQAAPCQLFISIVCIVLGYRLHPEGDARIVPALRCQLVLSPIAPHACPWYNRPGGF